ncbi:ATP-binding protein [Atopobium sp. oral taxon 810]|uniref:AlbA family DNA-binding domain-containing protein n=1 Tax=Atopobium sp. oral taxon 810 TaxID=712158 RepID=UPI0003966B42|nr:ATP-binding protein [Atopobium sp. oral taxon 810]ERI05131.1 hypothetical protein HMPREF9069_01053 [Atopobium sp. oral taxon 810 str. F0209]
MMKNVSEITPIVEKLRSTHKEGNYWDFKREWHSDKAELLYDIICLANNIEQDTSYLIIGVDENQNHIAVDVSKDANRRDTNTLTYFLSHKKWYGGMWPNAYVENITLDGVAVDVVVIEINREHLPYMLEQKYGQNIRPYAIYLRRNDANTPINDAAKFDEAARVWKRHFRLDLEPGKRIQVLLNDVAGWKDRPNNGDWLVEKYYENEPQYSLKYEIDSNNSGYEFYLCNQADSRPNWGNCDLQYDGTTIERFQLAGLDGMRYITPVPDKAYFDWNDRPHRDRDLVYRYFDMTSLRWVLHRFFYSDGPLSDETLAHDLFMECVLVFLDEYERRAFEDYLRTREQDFLKRVDETEQPYIDQSDFVDLSDRAVHVYANKLKQAKILRAMLAEYRATSPKNTLTNTER